MRNTTLSVIVAVAIVCTASIVNAEWTKPKDDTVVTAVSVTPDDYAGPAIAIDWTVGDAQFTVALTTTTKNTEDSKSTAACRKIEDELVWTGGGDPDAGTFTVDYSLNTTNMSAWSKKRTSKDRRLTKIFAKGNCEFASGFFTAAKVADKRWAAHSALRADLLKDTTEADPNKRKGDRIEVKMDLAKGMGGLWSPLPGNIVVLWSIEVLGEIVNGQEESNYPDCTSIVTDYIACPEWSQIIASSTMEMQVNVICDDYMDGHPGHDGSADGVVSHTLDLTYTGQ